MTKLNPRRVPVPTLDPVERGRHFGEVYPGYTEEQAIAEALRCILCPKPKCVEACPTRNDIPAFLKALQQRRFSDAMAVLERTNNLPAVCGRVCDHARQCEGACVIRKRGDPVAIGQMERFVADMAVGQAALRDRCPPDPVAGRVAIVGSGPAGLTAAEDLARRGHQVTVFEARPVAGGVLAWGIPIFRLPTWVLAAKLRQLASLGVEFRFGVRVGQDLSVEQLFQDGYQAVLLGVGTERPRPIDVPGETLQGVWQATDFLARVKLGEMEASPNPALQVGESVAVIGAGNTAFDAAQTALRLGASEVTIVYRRSFAEVPARLDEIESARQEGVRLHFLAAPTRFLGDAEGRVRQMECIRMKLSEPEADGRRRPVPDPGTEFLVDVDTVVLALGFQVDGICLKNAEEIKTGSGGLVATDQEAFRTSRQGVWAAGDIVTGPNTVVAAVAQAKRAALDIHRYLLQLASGNGPGAG